MSENQAVLPLSHIHMSQRYRKDFGDLGTLMQSMATIGLLHPIVVTPDHTLIAGARRLLAAKQLGWTAIPVHIVDIASLVRGEHDENAVRKDFTPTEKVAIGRPLEEEVKAAAAVRMAEGQKSGGKSGGRGMAKDSSVQILHRAIPPRARDIIASVTGMSHDTYTKAKAVVEAAEREPEAYGQLVTMNPETLDERLAARLDALDDWFGPPPTPAERERERRFCNAYDWIVGTIVGTFLLTLLVMLVWSSHAADTQGNSNVYGAGVNLTCRIYVTFGDKAANETLTEPEKVALFTIGQWSEGFVSAYNALTPNTIGVQASLGDILALTRRTCQTDQTRLMGFALRQTLDNLMEIKDWAPSDRDAYVKFLKTFPVEGIRR